MKKIIICLLIAFLLSFSGCADDVGYNYLNDTDLIKTIQIVQVGEIDSDGELPQVLISEIDNIREFLKDFEEMDCNLIFTDPKGVGTNTIAIKIIYDNSEYELISAEGQAHYTAERLFQYYKGYRSFEKEQFDNLISKYAKNNNLLQLMSILDKRPGL